MPNRYQAAARKDVYDTIARYEGEYCIKCFCEGAGRRGPKSGVQLQIDHAGRERHLLCGKHNRDMRRLSLRQHESAMAEYSAENVSERIKSGEIISNVRYEVDYREGSTEMQASQIILDRWLNFMNEYLKGNGQITLEAAQYAGAMASGGNPSTIYRHVKTFTQFNGPFEIKKLNGIKFIVYRASEPIEVLPTNGNGHNGNGNGHGKEVLENTIPLKAEK